MLGLVGIFGEQLRQPPGRAGALGDHCCPGDGAKALTSFPRKGRGSKACGGNASEMPSPSPRWGEARSERRVLAQAYRDAKPSLLLLCLCRGVKRALFLTPILSPKRTGISARSC